MTTLSEQWKKAFMLCQSIDETSALELDETNFTAQFKRDGWRVISIITNDQVILLTRRGRPCNNQFREIVEDLKKLPPCIIDGEITTLNDDFQLLQTRALTKNPAKLSQLEKNVPVVYEVFDILGVGNSTNKIDLILKDRKVELDKLFNGLEFEHVRLLAYGSIKEMLQKAKDNDGEGIIVKDLNGRYECNKRSPNWKKLKLWLTTDITITKYEIAVGQNGDTKGITAETDDGIRVAILGQQHEEVKEILDNKGSVEITIQYLSKSPEGRLRFPSFVKLNV